MAQQRWLVVAGVLLELLVLVVAGRADEAATARTILDLGGSVSVDPKRPGKPVVAVDLGGTKITDEGLKQLKEFKSLQRLNLTSTKVTDAGMKHLKALKSLRSLDLSFTRITDAGLKELKELKRLQELNLSETKVTDAGLKELKAALPGLQIHR